MVELRWWNWHKHWPLRGLLCNLDRHDFDHPTIDGDDILLMCVYCGKKRRCIGAARRTS